MSLGDRARRIPSVYGRRYGLLVATAVLFVAIYVTDRVGGSEPAYHDRDPDAFRELVNRPDVYTLDVHVPEQQHIVGTDAFIPYDAIRDNRHLLPDEDTPIALYCRSDSMSRQVTDVLSELGYGEIHHLRGGIRAWNDRDFPLTTYRFGEPGVRTDPSDSDGHTDPDDGDDP